MFESGFTRILIIALVIIIFVNPKDLPRMFRALGRIAGQLRELRDRVNRELEGFEEQARGDAGERNGDP